jgi:hypothetical protein
MKKGKVNLKRNKILLLTRIISKMWCFFNISVKFLYLNAGGDVFFSCRE